METGSPRLCPVRDEAGGLEAPLGVLYKPGREDRGQNTQDGRRDLEKKEAILTHQGGTSCGEASSSRRRWCVQTTAITRWGREKGRDRISQ